MQILKIKQVCKKIGMSRATVYRLLKIDQTFPKPLKLGLAAIGWLESDVDEWLNSKRAS